MYFTKFCCDNIIKIFLVLRKFAIKILATVSAEDVYSVTLLLQIQWFATVYEVYTYQEKVFGQK